MAKKLTEQQKKNIAENKKWAKEHPIENANLECAHAIWTTHEQRFIQEKQLKEIEKYLSKLTADQFHQMLLDAVICSPHLEIVKMFIKKGLEPNKVFALLCSFTTNPKVLEFLISAGAVVNQFDKKQWTPLMSVCANSEADMNTKNQMVQILINNGALVDAAENESGENALMICIVLNTDVTIIKTLLAAGSDVNFKDKFGNTAIQYAARYARNKEIIDVLLDAGATTDNAKIMAQAIENKNLDVKEYVFQKCLGITPETIKIANAEKEARDKIDKENGKFVSCVGFTTPIFALTDGLVLRLGLVVIWLSFLGFFYGCIVVSIVYPIFNFIEKCSFVNTKWKKRIKYLITAIIIILECYLYHLFLLQVSQK